MSDKNNQNEYRVLARKYRPQNFSNLIGQNTLVRSLTNAINNNRIAHAYILTGVRGVGKTTTARLIAMSLNCENRNKESCEPCEKCELCLNTKEDRNLDVIEMDAASKTGVDDIREIIENVKYKPVNCKYKIFIIDEVHMLSKSAFNALLKTLEEPPPHVKFIFATTEVNKVPITIISRCQRYDLHRVETSNLSNHLLDISKKEKIEIDNEAIALIVRAADGSVRDSLSLLDQAITNTNGTITSSIIIEMLGLADRAKIYDLIDSIFKGNSSDALEIFYNLYKSGADVIMIFDEILNIVHFITQVKIAPSLKDDIHIPELERKRGFEIAEKISMSYLGIAWQILFKGFQELQSGFHSFQHGEMIIIRLIYFHNGPSPNDLIKKVDKINQSTNIINKDTSSSNVKIESDQTVNKYKNEDNIQNKQSLTEKIDEMHGNLQVKSYRQFVDIFYQKKEAMIHTYLYNNVRLVSFKEGELIVNAKDVTDTNFTRNIAKLISKWTGRIWQVSTSTNNIGKTLYEEDLIYQQKEIENMKNDPEVKNILQKLPGSKIHSITNLNQTLDEFKLIQEFDKTKEK